MKHTPGPWKTLCGDWDKDFDGFCRYTIEPLKELNAADADLINSAPELLAALKVAQANLQFLPPTEVEEQIAAAIAKAEGRQ